MGQPAVLGELLAGVLLGSLDLLGVKWFTGLEHDTTIQAIASLGVIILLFEVGLKSMIRDMLPAPSAPRDPDGYARKLAQLVEVSTACRSDSA